MTKVLDSGLVEDGRQEILDLEDRFVDVQGVRMHYVHSGAGRPLVMIHGLTGSTANWRRNIAALAERASVYAVDLVNMGRSDRMPGVDTGLAAIADRVAAWMDAMGLDRADIAGHSHGGAIAMMLAARHPERVRSLMLFAPANPYCKLGHRLIRLYNSLPGRHFARIVPFLPRRIHMFALARMYGDPSRIVPGSLEGYTSGLRVPGTIDHVLQIVQSWFTQMRELKAVLPRLKQVPMLLVWGTRDRAVGIASGERLHRELPGSKFVMIPGAGHVPFEEMPAECNRAMLQWLRQMELPKKQVRTAAGKQTAREQVSAGLATARAAASSGLRQVSGQAHQGA